MASDPGSEAWGCIAQLFKSSENERRFVAIAEALGLTPRMLGGLLCLVPEEAKPMRAMVEEWHCDPSWVTTIVDELEQRGMVDRRVDTVDRRAKSVSLTEVGAKSRQEALDLLSVPPPGIAALSRAEQRTLRDLLRKATADLPPLR
ncbi:MAG: MarR family transcriptional regulator [Actinomycetota bacterium]|nr:MarR family transcriptional regulator [Actinomycetota bacterium]MDQ3354488.1 MarR family transcriptional regulator [Actinomycetota bacterium]